MGEFRRNRSKVWWSNYFREDEDVNEEKISSPLQSTIRFSWRRSLRIENSNRNSSSSPSNGSQKSQDSGFSDSESSSPSSCSLKESKNDNNQKEFKQEQNAEQTLYHNEIDKPANAEITSQSKSSDVQVNKIPRPCLIKRKKREIKNTKKVEKNLQLVKSKCDTIGSYLADCYFPITSFVNTDNITLVNRLTNGYKNPLFLEDQRYLETVFNNSRTQLTQQSVAYESNSEQVELRTCFIVDELPKKNITDGNIFNCKENKTSTTSLDTISLSSDEFKVDETVKYVEKKDCLSNNKQYAEDSGSQKMLFANVDSLTPFESNESRLSNLDLSHLEPTHTSTPKKEDIKFQRRTPHRKCKRSSSLVEEYEIDKSFDAPVIKWLNELKHRYEPECMTALQAKSMKHHSKPISIMISDSTSSIEKFQYKTEKIANEFLKLYENTSNCIFEQIESSLRNLINSIMEFIINYTQLLPRMESTGKENLLKLMDMCDRFRQTTYPFTTDQSSFLNDVHILDKFFSRFVDSVLTQQIIVLTTILETSKSNVILLNALFGITSLSLNTSRTCELITYFNGIENLLAICVQADSTAVRKAALRALAVVCQNAISIRKFELADGVEILSELLSDTNKSEDEFLEIISLLVQITAPWIEDDHIIKGLIYHLHAIINALTYIISKTNSCETLLLLAAALANISFIEPQAFFILLKLDTPSCLLTAVRKLGIRASIFLQEQVATLIANMAAVSETRPYLAQSRAVGALLCFLQMKRSPVQTVAETAAAKRLQHKSAVALSRLCTNVEISKQVIELQGVNRLVCLCREEKERNYSDGVLVACLAALRKITANCGNDCINQLNAKELVEPRLVDSFLLYSSRQESYV